MRFAGECPGSRRDSAGSGTDGECPVSQRAIVINCSASDTHGRPKHYYNLGAHKRTYWLRTHGYAVDYHHGDPGLFLEGVDLVCLSVIFSWHAPLARDIAIRVRSRAEVWCGGPGMFALAHWWTQQTGLP